ncbi:GerMN domain-containing protein [Streptomyces sp. 900116325]|uniref:GerMN domain-containing protein n=1 Tax=Streptomyces sp. NPDC000133 TaxID=3364535 RepID=UPI00369F37B1
MRRINCGTRRARRAAGALVGAVVCAVLAAGCGIRTTSVPVDAGAAPSRVPCSMSAEDVSTQAMQGIPVQIYLICASQLVTVDRSVQIHEAKSDRIRVAQALLDELQEEPAADERQAGFSTDVPATLRIGGARGDDPAAVIRLSEQPEDLPSEALAQIVCTYAESESLASDGTVLLGGPGNYAPRAYLCTSETKARPEAVPTLGAAKLS